MQGCKGTNTRHSSCGGVKHCMDRTAIVLAAWLIAFSASCSQSALPEINSPFPLSSFTVRKVISSPSGKRYAIEGCTRCVGEALRENSERRLAARSDVRDELGEIVEKRAHESRRLVLKEREVASRFATLSAHEIRHRPDDQQTCVASAGYICDGTGFPISSYGGKATYEVGNIRWNKITIARDQWNGSDLDRK